MSGGHTELLSAPNKSLSLEFRLFVWSLLTEPLLFFVVGDQDGTGVNLTYARILQASFLSLWFLKYALRGGKLVVPSPTYPLYRYFSIYLMLLLLSSVAGLIFYDSYTLLHQYENWTLTGFADVIRGPYSRPFVETFILFYYFIYYIVLPKYIINSRQKIEYLFKWLIKIFKMMLLLGFLDLAMQLTTDWFIPKHLSNADFGYVGFRFHALLGEPRDAVPYLFFGLSMLFLWKSVNYDIKINKKLILFCLFALVMTQSASGLIGLGLTSIGMGFVYIVKNIKKLIKITAIGIIFILIFVYLASFSPRMIQYFDAFVNLLDILNNEDELPVLVAFQVSNFLPFWAIWLDIKQLNLMPVLFGSGIGSVSYANNNLIRTFVQDANGGLFNPNAQITRVIYDSGLIGTIFYFYALYYPLKAFLKKYICHYDMILMLFMLLMGACLAHRNTAIFVYVGVLIVLLTNWPRNELQNTKKPLVHTA